MALKMVFTGRPHNMSFYHENRRAVTKNRQYVLFKNNFTFLAGKKSLSPRGFAPKISHDNEVRFITQDNRKDFEGVGVFRKSNVTGSSVITNLFNFLIIFPPGDCLPVVLHDSLGNVMAVIDGGREELIGDIVGKTIDHMELFFGSQARNLIAYFFPCICRKCYELEYLPNKFDNLPEEQRRLVSMRNGNFLFPLREIIMLQLKACEVQTFIPHLGWEECTCCSEISPGNKKYFSNYGWEKKKPGHEIRGNNGLFVEMRA